MPYRKLKTWIKGRVIGLCRGLDALSASIQKRLLHATLEELRAQKHMTLPADRMDENLLGQFIRYMGHALEKAVRNEYEEGRGREKYEVLKEAIAQHRKRGYPERTYVAWAEEHLASYEEWCRTKTPQRVPAAKPSDPLDPDALFNVIRNRTSIRFWAEKPVAREQIEKILRAATYAPSSCNRQPWYFHVVVNETSEREAPACGVSNVSLREKAPAVIYIAVDERLYPEKYAPAIDAGIAGMQMSLAATALGLGNCMMYGGENFPQEEVKAKLGIPDPQYIYLLLLLGHPDETTTQEKRVHIDDAARFNEP
jgi:nitroreductase